MAQLTIQDVIEAGLNVAYENAASGGDTVVNIDGDIMLHVRNTDVSSRTVTVTAQDVSEEVSGFGQMSKANAVVAVPAGEERFIGPFPTKAFNNASNQIAISYSAVTNVTIAALRLRRAR